MKRLFAALLALVIASPALTEHDEYSGHSKHHQVNGEANAFGVFGTVYWTWGFGYRRHFSNGLGFTTSLGAWIDNSHAHVGPEIGLLYSFGNYRFPKSALPDSSIRVYAIGYVAPIYEWQKRSNQHIFHFGFGAGPGVEYFFNRHFSIHAEVPWMTFFRAAKAPFESGFHTSYPHVGGGIAYYF